MKYLLIVAMLMMSACTSSTEFGKCIGLTGKEQPNLVYKPSVKNLILGVVFSEMIAPPVLVLVNEFSCPVGTK